MTCKTQVRELLDELQALKETADARFDEVRAQVAAEFTQSTLALVVKAAYAALVLSALLAEPSVSNAAVALIGCLAWLAFYVKEKSFERHVKRELVTLVINYGVNFRILYCNLSNASEEDAVAASSTMDKREILIDLDQVDEQLHAVVRATSKFAPILAKLQSLTAGMHVSLDAHYRAYLSSS